MKVIFFILALVLSVYSSNVVKLKAEILSTISHALIRKNKINICVADSDLLKIQGYVPSLNFVSCKKASIIFTSDIKQINKNCKLKYIFATTYHAYIHAPNAIGAFFWQKGRPNIIFRKRILQKFHIKLPLEFHKYIE